MSDSYTDSDTGFVVGRVRALRDNDGDGFADSNEVVVDKLPNGRHDTNGMAFGPKGFLYVTNGSRTDDGIHGSACLCDTPDGSCTVCETGFPGPCPCPGEDQPYSGALLRVDASKRNQTLADVRVEATGMRNIFDVAFLPRDSRFAYLPTNGPDDPEADDLLFRTRVDESKVDDMGFPSCLYNVGPDNEYPLEPVSNPHPEVIAAFGPCDKKLVKKIEQPLLTFGKHANADGLAFAPANFAAAFEGDLFVAEFGNNDVFAPAGRQVVRIDIGPDGLPVLDATGIPIVERFAFGPPDDPSDAANRPVDLVFGPDSAMYVTDIFVGSVFRIARQHLVL